MKPLIDYIYKHKKEFSLIMGGDVLSHAEVYNDARTNYGYDFSPIFSKIVPMIKSSDLAFCNQESVLGDEKLPNYKLIQNKYKKYINYENTTTTT